MLMRAIIVEVYALNGQYFYIVLTYHWLVVFHLFASPHPVNKVITSYSKFFSNSVSLFTQTNLSSLNHLLQWYCFRRTKSININGWWSKNQSIIYIVNQSINQNLYSAPSRYLLRGAPNCTCTTIPFRAYIYQKCTEAYHDGMRIPPLSVTGMAFLNTAMQTSSSQSKFYTKPHRTILNGS